jgi:hypothetical protein
LALQCLAHAGQERGRLVGVHPVAGAGDHVELDPAEHRAEFRAIALRHDVRS